jgi:hypothetical protein
MTGIYYAEMGDVLRAAGLEVAETEVNRGWETRARSSGGFPAPPLGVWWHHTASDTTPTNDLSWMIDGSDDAPIGNLLIDRSGACWPIAAGASNCAGKGGPATFSRGTAPADGGNTRGWQIEVANNGLGQPWPTVQIDAYFAASNALNALAGNRPTDAISHRRWAPDRKIDPATADAVQGLWRPGAETSSGTWDLDDITAEAARRADATIPPPNPPPTGADIVFTLIHLHDNDAALGGNMDPHGIAAQVTWLNPRRYEAIANAGAPTVWLHASDLINCDLLGPIPPGLEAAHFANVIT